MTTHLAHPADWLLGLSGLRVGSAAFVWRLGTQQLGRWWRAPAVWKDGRHTRPTKAITPSHCVDGKKLAIRFTKNR